MPFNTLKTVHYSLKSNEMEAPSFLASFSKTLIYNYSLFFTVSSYRKGSNFHTCMVHV